MGWRLNRALTGWRAAIDARFPNRDRTSDGTIGDAAHQASTSDHNPDPDGTVAYARLVAKIDISNGPNACHPWTGYQNRKGYGVFRVGGRTQLAHRWLLGHLRGRPLGPAEVACHHCDNPRCCNPAHLYIGDAVSNVRDREARTGNGGGRFMAAKTHCPKGHPYDDANTYVAKNGGRLCRSCGRDAARARRAAKQKARADQWLGV